MSSSVWTGRDSLPREASAVIVHLCDYPLVSASTINRMIMEHCNSPDCIIIPCYQKRRGHPLLFPRTILDELGSAQILRDLVHKDSKRVVCIDVEDFGVLLDMDTPEDYHRICNMIKLRYEHS